MPSGPGTTSWKPIRRLLPSTQTPTCSTAWPRPSTCSTRKPSTGLRPPQAAFHGDAGCRGGLGLDLVCQAPDLHSPVLTAVRMPCGRRWQSCRRRPPSPDRPHTVQHVARHGPGPTRKARSFESATSATSTTSVSWARSVAWRWPCPQRGWPISLAAFRRRWLPWPARASPAKGQQTKPAHALGGRIQSLSHAQHLFGVLRLAGWPMPT